MREEEPKGSAQQESRNHPALSTCWKAPHLPNLTEASGVIGPARFHCAAEGLGAASEQQMSGICRYAG